MKDSESFIGCMLQKPTNATNFPPVHGHKFDSGTEVVMSIASYKLRPTYL